MKIGTWTPVPVPDSSGAGPTPDPWQDAAGGEDFSGVLATYDKDGARPSQDNASAESAQGRSDGTAANASGDASSESGSPASERVDTHQPASIVTLLSRAAISPAGAPGNAVKSGIDSASGAPPGAPATLDPDAVKSKSPAQQHRPGAALEAGSAADEPSGDRADAATPPASANAVGIAPDLISLLNSAIGQTAPLVTGPGARLADQGSAAAVLSAAGAARDAMGAKQAGHGPAAATHDGESVIPPEESTISLSHVATASQIAPQTKLAVSSALSGPEQPFPSPLQPDEGGKGTSAGGASTPEPAPTAVDPLAGGTEASAAAPIAPSAGNAAVLTPLARAVLDLAQAEPASPVNQANQPEASVIAPPPARTLTLQLSPANLGTITVRLHVTGSALDVDLTVSDPQTLGLINREHDTLAGALRDHDYDLNSLVIQGAPVDATSTGDQNAQTTGGRNQAAADHQTSSGSNPRGRDRPQSSARQERDDRPSPPDSPAARAGGLLFV